MALELKKIIGAIAIFISIVIGGLLLILLSLLLPEDAIHKHVVESASVFIEEGSFPHLIKDYEPSVPDNNTDAWMLLIADFHDEEMGAFEQALCGYYRIYVPQGTGLDGYDNIIRIQDEQAIGIRAYTRYWHGWLFFLRLLLCFLSYKGIRIFNLILMSVLLIAVAAGLWIKKQRGLIAPLCISVFIMLPNIVFMSMAYMISFCISMVSILVILFAGEKIKNSIGMPVFFMVIGMVTAYSEFLQFPIITLGLPLIVYLYIGDKEKEGVTERVKMALLFSVMWAVGYFGMWMSKWIVATALTRHDIIADAVSQIKIRTSGTKDPLMSEKMSRWAAIVGCFGRMNIRPFLVVLGFGLWIYFCAIAVHGFRNAKANLINALPYLIVSLIPFAWAIVFANHTYMHSHFVYRIFIVSIFAFYAWTAEFLNDQAKKN